MSKPAKQDDEFLAMYQQAMQGGRRRDSQCGVTLALKDMTPERAGKLRELIDADVTAWRVANVFVSLGYTISLQTVTRHRNRGRGGCKCPE